MKKIIMALVLILTLSIVIVFSGCSKKQEVIIIKYAAWNLGALEKNSIERQMINDFNNKHTNIKVEIDESFVKNYDTAFKEESKKNNLPDVFMYVSNPLANTNGWSADLTDIVSKDEEWGNIPKALREAVQINGKVIAIPTSMYLYGYYYNEDLFKAQGVNFPSNNLSINEFKSIVEKMTNINKGSIGLADESSIVDWYPAAVNKKFGWYTWDGGKFNLNSSEFKAGVSLAKYIYTSKQTYASISDEEKKKLKGSNDWEAWNAGTVSLKFDGSWSSEDYSKLPFKVGFCGIPGGRFCVVPDFLIISKKSKHPKEAYEFAKYMSTYSLEGFNERMKLSKSSNAVIASLPMIKDEQVINDYFSTIKIEGLKTVFSKIEDSSYVEGVKVLPGYAEARWNYNTNIKIGKTENAKIGDVLTNTYRGNLKIENIASQLNYYANESIQLFPRQSEN